MPAPTSTAPHHPAPARASTLRETVQVLSEDIGERNLAHYGALEKSRSYLTKSLEQMGYAVEVQSYRGNHFEETVHNLIVTLPGNQGIVVVGAHYDSAIGTPGANDNGSGVAVLLELARRLKDVKFERTVRFVFFVNEEPPHFMTSDMGSLVYAKACAERGDKVVGMISLETMGYYSDRQGSQRFPPGITGYPDTGNFLGFVAEPNSQQFLQECLDSFQGLPVESLVAAADLEGVSWSDHASFWRYGYPAIMVTDTAPFRYPHYHRPTDTVDRIDFERLRLATDGMENVVRALGRAE